MIKKIKALYIKYREIIIYVFFGGLTTVINYAVYMSVTDLLGFPVLSANVIAWVAAVLFAYFTNRRWVFKSESKGKQSLREFVSFIGARVFSLLLEEAILLIFVENLGYNDKIVKVIASVLVVIINYILSKVLVFRGR